MTDLIGEFGQSAVAAGAMRPANAEILACSAPSKRVGPVFTTFLRRPILLNELELAPKGRGYTSLACVLPAKMRVFIAFDPLFQQTWNLTDLTLGDLQSTIALAPSEQVTLEFQTTQRKVLDQSTLDSTENLNSSESTSADTESVNVTRASSRTQAWHVDTTGTLTCGYASLSTTFGYSSSVTDTNQQAISHVTNTTHRSAQSLKTMHKIEVRGVSESVVENRLTRVVKNPYRDRALSVNVFQLIKHFSVKTELAETRIAMVFRFDGLTFDAPFVRSYADFLRATLLDSTLLDDLPTAITAATPPLPTTVLDKAEETARRALRFLYSYDGSANDMFHVKHIGPPAIDPNVPSHSFIADHSGRSGLEDAVRNNSEGLFAVLNYFWKVINDPVDDGHGNDIKLVNRGDDSIRIATALAAEVRAEWTLLYPDPLKSDKLANLFDQEDLTEIFRRVPGFLTMVEGILQPMLDPAQVERDQVRAYQQAQGSLSRLIAHLECNRHYYVERFLRYLHTATTGNAIRDFAQDQLRLLPQVPVSGLLTELDVDRAYIDKLEVIVPGYTMLTNAKMGEILGELHLEMPVPQDPIPQIIPDLQVPADGIHLEAAAGACVLKNVPPDPGPNVDLSVQNLELHAVLTESEG